MLSKRKLPSKGSFSLSSLISSSSSSSSSSASSPSPSLTDSSGDEMLSEKNEQMDQDKELSSTAESSSKRPAPGIGMGEETKTSAKATGSTLKSSSSSKLVAKSASTRPKSTILPSMSSSSSKDQGKVSITLSTNDTKEPSDDALKNSGSTTTTTATSSSSTSSSSSSSSQKSVISRIMGKASANPPNNKYSTLPLPPKSKFPASSNAPNANTATNAKTTTTSSSSSSSLSKSSTPKTAAVKPPANRILTPFQLQQQAQQLQQQIQQQKQLLEQQQQQLQNQQQTKQQLEEQLQQQQIEKQLQQRFLEQQLLEQQLKQTQFHQQLHELHLQLKQPQYSADARHFIAQFPFQPHHANKEANPSTSDFIQGGTYAAEFMYTPAHAVEAYKDWRESQWLLPQSFASQLDPNMLIPMYLPFYSFSLFSYSVHSGRIGHFKKASESTGGELSSMEFDYMEDRVESSTHSQLHPNVLVYAPTFESVTTPDYDLMQDIWYWKVNDELLKPQTQVHTRHSLPMLGRSNSSSSVDVKMLHSATIPEAWAYAKKKLVENEQYCSSQVLKKECGCDIVEDVRTDTSFSHIVVKLIYLPVYVWVHAYQGITYHTVMNGQNGLVSGRRPYALKSSLDSCIKLLAGGEQVGKSDNITGLLSGADLALRDNVEPNVYRADAWYLLFPPSDQFLTVVATGWLRLQNLSEQESVELCPQKRIAASLGRSIVLGPLEERVVAYRGAWCLCVVTGDPHAVIVSFVSTNSGADKEDAMGMV